MNWCSYCESFGKKKKKDLVVYCELKKKWINQKDCDEGELTISRRL